MVPVAVFGRARAHSVSLSLSAPSPLSSASRCRARPFERRWWDDGPRACPSSRYRARDRETSRGRPPSRGHEGRLVSQTQRALELTECSPQSTTATSRQCFCPAPSYTSPRREILGVCNARTLSPWLPLAWNEAAFSSSSSSQRDRSFRSSMLGALLLEYSPWVLFSDLMEGEVKVFSLSFWLWVFLVEWNAHSCDSEWQYLRGYFEEKYCHVLFFGNRD